MEFWPSPASVLLRIHAHQHRQQPQSSGSRITAKQAVALSDPGHGPESQLSQVDELGKGLRQSSGFLKILEESFSWDRLIFGI